MRAVVFAGPSIDAATVAGIAPVELRPPVMRGDVDALLAEPEPVTHIGIVDGGFLQGLMISPKELMRALDGRNPVKLFGSSSIGALRAVELADWGMTGVGRIYEMYRSGQVDEDDEVAITYDPDSLRALCEPMVNIRIAIEAALAEKVVDATAAETVIAIAKEFYFPDRTYDRILRAVPEAAGVDVPALREFLATRAPDAKREDAIRLLRHMMN
ncbi:TfuA-like protein [Rhizohabitans arisaemae]|uniref:TfuA-like protein n=1 Tax=Rhizohabitans arisaemae TaxID=2720610 RepID=UPI0024B21041|nr:TfuA-like protein [Rhizohabitans arisaemae]